MVFRLVAADTDPDNVKATEASKRRFHLDDGEGAVALEEGELVCRFRYDADADGRQDAVNGQTEARILDLAPPAWRATLRLPAPLKGQEPRTLLGWHLRQYTERNQRDYFIHKDLGGFLGRELDQYLKTEVFDLDAVEGMGPDDVGRALAMVKTVRAVARPIIAFLASLEDFQKRLYLKKKMVLRTEWCVTLDRVPEALHPQIAANKRQVQRWKDLFAIQELDFGPIAGGAGTGETVTLEFLKRCPGLVVETACWDDGGRFKGALLGVLGAGIDRSTAGLLLRGENVQALRELQASVRREIGCVYIDPPYNTGDDGFAYKDRYQHSSWSTMVEQRLRFCLGLLAGEATFLVSINDLELSSLRAILNNLLGESNHVGNLVWKGATDNNPTQIAIEHEYIVCHAIDKRLLDSQWSTSEHEVKQAMLDAFDRITASAGSATAVLEEFEAWTAENREYLGDLYRYRRVDGTGPYAARRNMENPGKPGYRYDVIHPVTKLPTAKPYWGWRFPESTMQRLLAEGRIIFGSDEKKIPELKVYLKEVKFPLRSVFSIDSRKGSNDLDRLFGSRDVFKNPKPCAVLKHVLPYVAPPGATILDFFAGSGTTGHAVIELNREDHGNRRFILVEVNDYFDTVLVPRILKATHSKEWKDGKPVDRTPLPGGALYKVLYLESYEDTLANVVLPPSTVVGALPFAVRRDYVVRYMLDRETRQAVLDVDRFRNPFTWKMEVRRGGTVLKDHPVDLVETFNYLLGLRVSRVGYFGSPDRVRYVEGMLRDGDDERRALVVWRDCAAVSDDEVVRMFQDREFAPISSREYDRIYVNGDPPLANVRGEGETWKVLAIEDEFRRLSFADDEDR